MIVQWRRKWHLAIFQRPSSTTYSSSYSPVLTDSVPSSRFTWRNLSVQRPDARVPSCTVMSGCVAWCMSRTTFLPSTFRSAIDSKTLTMPSASSNAPSRP